MCGVLAVHLPQGSAGQRVANRGGCRRLLSCSCMQECGENHQQMLVCTAAPGHCSAAAFPGAHRISAPASPWCILPGISALVDPCWQCALIYPPPSLQGCSGLSHLTGFVSLLLAATSWEGKGTQGSGSRSRSMHVGHAEQENLPTGRHRSPPPSSSALGLSFSFFT